MVKRLSHTSIFVTDQEKAYDFYVNKLGCKVNTDATMENGFRWLTVTAPLEPNLEIALMPANNIMFDEETRNLLGRLLEKGAMGAGIWETSDCRASYEELKAKRVEFKSEHKEQFYGIEAVMTDGCGNWFSLTQPK